MNKKRAYTVEEKKKLRIVLFAFLGVAALLVGLDALAKWLVQINLQYEGRSIEVIPNFFYITLIHNTGSAFGMGKGSIGSRVIFILISIIMSGVILYYWIKNYKELNKFEHALAALLAAGAVGNLVDRALYFPEIVGFNGVIDFFQFYLGGGPAASESFLNPFATFNPADAYLVVGVIIVAIYCLVLSYKDHQKNTAKVIPEESADVEEVEVVEEIIEVEESEEKDESSNSK